MKKILFSLSLVSLLFSCSSSNDSGEEIPSKELNPTAVEESIAIKGSTKTTGTPPAANGDLNFETKASTANSADGFFIEINTTDEIDGAYIQLLDADGKPTDSYIDVPETSFTSNDYVQPVFNTPTSKGTTPKKDDDTVLIDVNFTTNLTPGTFCYFICVYDEETGYVSEPTEVCITVNDWGGNDNLVGTWIPDPEDTDNGFTNTCYTFNEFYPEITCTNGNTVQPEGEICFNYLLELAIANSGDFNYNIQLDYKTLNIEASEEQCTTVLDTLNIGYTYIGKWSYDASSEILTLVLQTLQVNNESVDYEEGVLIYSDKASLSNGKLILNGDFINSNFTKK